MKVLKLAAAIAALATPTFAGGPTLVEADPMPEAMAAPVAAYDWSGFYAGLSYGRTTNSEIVDTTIGPVYQLSKGSVSGLHLGYLAQRSRFVFGGELSYMKYDDVIMAGLAGYHMDRTLDLKGRLGFAAN
ncbi:MAG: hypothetical protein FD150_1385 [Rhodobacteraceae bacterium]|nr:MAG: hypothetical protein FD150_1385 [Paracoccaceae bacterium]